MNRPPKGDEYRRGNFAGMMFQPSANDTPDMTVRIKQGAFWINNEKFVEYAGGVSPKIEAPRTGAKWVLVALNKAGKCVLVNGAVRSNNPEPPTLSQNMLPLAFVYVKSSTTVITNDMVYDARPEFSVGGYPINHADLQNRNKENAHSIESISGLRDELDDKISLDDTKNLIRNKADYDGTFSSSFTLNVDDSGVPVEHCGIYVNRGALPKVGIKYNEDLDEWQYTNDGTNWLSWAAGINVPDASATEFGVVKLSVDPNGESIAVGINDPKYLSIDEKVSKNDLRAVYITREEVNDKLEDKMDVEGTYSKDDINAIFVTKSSLNNTLLDTYTRAQIDSFLNVKANASQVYTKEETAGVLQSYYTKEETDAILEGLDFESIKNFDVSNYYVKSEVDTLLQNVVTSTYTRIALDAMLETKADAVETHSALDAKADVDSVYSKEYIDGRFSQADADARNLFYEKSDVDLLLANRALVNHNHSSGDIIEDSAHKFVSENQIDSWNSKQDALSFVPENSSMKGAVNGYAPLDSNGQIPIQYIPNEAKDEDAMIVVDTYNDLLAIPDMNLKEGKHFGVLDATGDPTGVTGKAEYVYHNNEFVCLLFNSTVTSVDWSNITNIPSDLGGSVDLSNYYTIPEIDSQLSSKADIDNVFSKDETITLVNSKADVGNVYTKNEIDSVLDTKASFNDVYSKIEIDNRLYDKADVSSVYTKNEIDALIPSISGDVYSKSEVDNLIADIDAYSKSDTDNLLSAKADSSDVYTKTEVDNLLPVIDAYSKTEVDNLLDDKANINSVYSKDEIDALIPADGLYSRTDVDNMLGGKANSSDVYTKDEVDALIPDNETYSRSEIDSLMNGKANSESVYSKDEIDGIVDSKANIDDTYSKKEVDDLVSQISVPTLQEFTSGDCTFVAYEEDAISFSKTGNSVSITKNKEVQSVRFSVSTTEIGDNNRIFIDYDAGSSNNDILTYNYANVQYIQLMGSKGATRVGTNIYYTNESNPHYCECALSFGNQGPVVVKITY